jgi:predicted lipid-binding transport protein (Tim44 family)
MSNSVSWPETSSHGTRRGHFAAGSLPSIPQGIRRFMSETEREQTERAAAEAGSIGGRTSSEPPATESDDPAIRPLTEAGQGEAEGFEQAERDLVEHASHGDQHAARRVTEDAPAESDDARAARAGEADEERSSELRDEEAP